MVVGAGPVGLLLAAELRRHGVGCRVIDKLTQPMNWVKALGVSPRTLEVWDDLGIAAAALDAGLTLRRQHVFVNRQPVLDADATLPDDVPYKNVLLLPQPETERILREHLARFGVQVERGVELRSFVEDGDGVRATLARADGEETVACRYLVGCDGAHSTVRHGLGLAFEGGRFPVEFLLADVQIHWELSHDAACLFLETRDDTMENLLACIPYKDRSAPDRPRYRVSTMARPVSQADWADTPSNAEPPPAAEPTLEQVRDLVRQFVPLAARVEDLRWSSVFRISHRIVSRYRVGRVFLAGDAAHIHPPTGGQGMNTGLQDAYNLAWKLALDVRGLAHPDLLDSYDAERRPVGEAVVSRTRQRSININDRSQHDVQALRDDSQLWVNYRDSRWVGESLSRPDALAAGPQPGDRAPNATGLARDGGTLSLFDLLRGSHHTLLVYGSGETPPLADALRRYGEAIKSYHIVAPGTMDSQTKDGVRIVDSDSRYKRLFAAVDGTTYLIRPDGYVGFRADAFSADSLKTYLTGVFRS